MDYSTLNLDELRKLPTYTLPPTYRLQQGSGNGCYMDPPGYPTYFTQHIWTQYGNHVPWGRPSQVIVFEGKNYVVHRDEDHKDLEPLFRRLWLPLPLDHERTRLWILSLYGHFRNCYQDVERPEFGRPGTLIYPVPDYKLKTFTDNPLWDERYRQAAKAEVREFNRQEIRRAKKIATPDNHQAVVSVREFYPDYQPDKNLIANPPEKHVPDWWETEATQPTTPEECNKTQRNKGPFWRHPINHTWCQWCGWSAEAA